MRLKGFTIIIDSLPPQSQRGIRMDPQGALQGGILPIFLSDCLSFLFSIMFSYVGALFRIFFFSSNVVILLAPQAM